MGNTGLPHPKLLFGKISAMLLTGPQGTSPSQQRWMTSLRLSFAVQSETIWLAGSRASSLFASHRIDRFAPEQVSPRRLRDARTFVIGAGDR
jgi:hypothetical protein